ncbi:glucoamylase glam [Gilbertella persicaria]|uniref:glucoamylase glam n=1 Tax=Gilbertella persicaria TaxID=101096 RepID=UPI00221E48FE|nr:glucoamylase glam [Gilbertella persicaria]KAI8075404.1 glucoamylase glam [Gilbertella persicaria]
MVFSKLFKKPILLIVTYLTVTVVAETVPTSAQVQVKSFNYDGSTLSGQIYVQNIAYEKTVTVVYSDGSDNWNNNGNTIAASYSSSISGSNYEYWTFSSSVPSIKQFYIKYVVAGKTYYDNNGTKNYQVSASTPTTTTTTTSSGATKTTTTIGPTSTSTVFPSGNSTISSWLKGQIETSRFAMLRNINPAGTVKGFIAASLSTANPDYFYAWTRDAALVGHVIANDYNRTLAGNSTYLGLLKDYVTFSVNSQSTSTICNCLGEPKFNKDGSGYSGAWGRPQNDGPAERADTFILIADSILKQTGDATYVTGTLRPAIYKDLDYVVNVWSNGCFDLWEEVNGVHFYTLMVMRRSLILGANFASRNGDSTRASTYTNTANSIKTKIDTFWSSSNNYVAVSQSVTGGVNKAGYDVANLIAANVGSLDDGFYTPGSERILATAVAVESKFASIYGVNQNLPSWLGNSIGRYPEDTYNGNGNSQGNPWFIATNTYAELYYRAIKEWTNNGGVTVTNVNFNFFKKFDSSASVGTKYTVGTSAFNTLTQNVALAADNFFSTVKVHAATNGSMSEQFGRDSGVMTGARDLTWSHASLITAALAKTGAPVA